MKLVLVRHGECSTGKRYTGSGSDVPLNSEGIAQIKDIAKSLREIIDKDFIEMYSSSLLRARESCEFLSFELGIDNFIIDNRLNEIHFGHWEGLTYNEIMDSWDELARKWYDDPTSVTPPDGESFDSFNKRIKQFWDDLMINDKQDTIILVTHGGVIQILSSFIFNDSIDNRWNYNIPRGSYRVFNL